ncbi:uncharacterized protein LOC143462443 isoform X2 [Clavelina lepadiformis]|uniref:uncharacterized protein LOC143462443 isoform X2 n=1 Tax=Clavelina lepadiformis TaxID=159417 RepID=UPI004041D0F3
MSMANNVGRTNRPYRKASEYLVNSQKPSPVASAFQIKLEQENENLQQKVLILTRKLERSESDFEQSREYLENQLDLAHDKQRKTEDEYMKLQSSYAALQTTNRELEEKLAKVINHLKVERDNFMTEINELTNKVTESRNALLKAQEENERLRKDCNLAVQLLKCNQSNYEVRRTEELPEGLQERVSNYKMELQNYNEYINPYAEGASDTESDEESFHRSNNSNKFANQFEDRSAIPVEVLAEVLKKPENVHMNLEPSDYIQDPALHSVYKAHYQERKLIKPNYDDNKGVNISQHQQPTEEDNGSPWERQLAPKQSSNEESSPWELAPSRMPDFQNVEDDDGSAGAYGAYSVRPKRRPQKRQINPYPEKSREKGKAPHDIGGMSNKQPPTSETVGHQQIAKMAQSASKIGISYLRSRSPSPDTLDFRQPEDLEFRKAAPPPSKTALSKYISRSSKSSPSMTSSSSNSSRKNTPLKVRGKEAATNAETSSLINAVDSDEENTLASEPQYLSAHTSPDKSYLKRETGMEGGSLSSVENDEVEVVAAPSVGEIDLEWDPTLTSHHPPEIDEESQEMVVLEKETAKIILQEKGEVQHEPDLLLSYTNVESPKKDLHQFTLEDLENDNANLSVKQSNDNLLMMENLQSLPSPQHTGQLLSEIVNTNPSLENFLITSPPPPPQEFACAQRRPRQIYNSDVSYSKFPITKDSPSFYPELTFKDHDPVEKGIKNTADGPLESEVESTNQPVRVDEQVIVIDLDEEPRKRVATLRRRNSLDQAQEFGNVME